MVARLARRLCTPTHRACSEVNSSAGKSVCLGRTEQNGVATVGVGLHILGFQPERSAAALFGIKREGDADHAGQRDFRSDLSRGSREAHQTRHRCCGSGLCLCRRGGVKQRTTAQSAATRATAQNCYGLLIGHLKLKCDFRGRRCGVARVLRGPRISLVIPSNSVRRAETVSLGSDTLRSEANPRKRMGCDHGHR